MTSVSERILRSAPLKKAQKRLLSFLRASNGKTITLADILAETKWKDTTWRVYEGKGFFDPYLTKTKGNQFRVHVGDDVDEWAFYRQVTQTIAARTGASALEDPLARALVEKARENMILALETYNRPSLRNRLDAFCMLFCAAWEQLLKAELIESGGEDAIFTGGLKGTRRETISLQDCIESQIGKTSPVGRNLAVITDLRHQATHLLMPEVQAAVSQVFQAGVLNFADRFKTFCSEKFLPSTSTGLLALVHEGSPVDAVSLKKLYGELTSADINSLISEIQASVASEKDRRFAVTIEYRLTLATKQAAGDIVLVPGASGPYHGVIVEKMVPSHHRYPHQTKDLVMLVARTLGRPFSREDALAVVAKEGWKNSDNEHHHLQRKPDTHKYSELAVQRICELVQLPEYLGKARAWRKSNLKKKQSRSRR